MLLVVETTLRQGVVPAGATSAASGLYGACSIGPLGIALLILGDTLAGLEGGDQNNMSSGDDGEQRVSADGTFL